MLQVSGWVFVLNLKLSEEDNTMDTLGKILWMAMFLTPLATIPISWKLIPAKGIYKIITGLVFAALLSFLLYYISLSLIFRNGMGPG